MTPSPEALARASARHPRRTLALWGVALVASIGIIGALLGDSLTTEGRVTSNPESERLRPDGLAACRPSRTT